MNRKQQTVDCSAIAKRWAALKRAFCLLRNFCTSAAATAGRAEPGRAHFELVYLVTAFVPSLTACLASSPGRSRRTAVWISLDVMVERRL